MKRLLWFTLLTSVFVASIANARTVEIDVHGMTCAFCVDSLERKFGEMKAVSEVKVSLTHKKVRLETEDAMPSIETIKRTILDAGFTPIKVVVDPYED